MRWRDLLVCTVWSAVLVFAVFVLGWSMKLWWFLGW